MRRAGFSVLLFSLLFSLHLPAQRPAELPDTFAFPASATLIPNGMVQFEQLFVDFGGLNRNDTAEVVFRFFNFSEDSLWVLGILPGCECTTGKLPEKPIPPSQSGNFSLFFIPSERDQGRQYKHARVFMNTEPCETEVQFSVFVRGY